MLPSDSRLRARQRGRDTPQHIRAETVRDDDLGAATAQLDGQRGEHPRQRTLALPRLQAEHLDAARRELLVQRSQPLDAERPHLKTRGVKRARPALRGAARPRR